MITDCTIRPEKDSPISTAAERYGLRYVAKRAVLRGGITVAGAGGRLKQIITKTMTNSNLSLANRKQLADMLSSGRYDSPRDRAKAKLREKRKLLQETLLKDFADKKGAFKLKTQIEITKEKLSEQTRELHQLGFDFDYGNDVELRGDAGRVIRKTIDERLDKELGSLESVDAQFDAIQIALMTVASLEDAEKLLKSVSAI